MKLGFEIFLCLIMWTIYVVFYREILQNLDQGQSLVWDIN